MKEYEFDKDALFILQNITGKNESQIRRDAPHPDSSPYSTIIDYQKSADGRTVISLILSQKIDIEIQGPHYGLYSMMKQVILDHDIPSSIEVKLRGNSLHNLIDEEWAKQFRITNISRNYTDGKADATFFRYKRIESE